MIGQNETVLVEADGILRWNQKKPGRTVFSAKDGDLVLVESGLIHAGEQELVIPIESITSCRFVKKLGGMTSYLSVEFTDSSGVPQAVSFSDKVRMPHGKDFQSEIERLAEVSGPRS